MKKAHLVYVTAIMLMVSTLVGAASYLTGDTIRSPDRTKVWTMPAATDTIMGRASVDVMTNKSFNADGTGNSITNIENADIKSGAAIAVNKLAALTTSRAVVTDGSGVLSPATTTATEIGYVNGVTSSLCGISQSCTMSNKTLSDSLTIAEIATPSTPSSGFGRIYFKSDNKLYQQNDLGTEALVGAGASSGSVNFMSANPDFESDATGYSTYADAAGTTPVDCTGGSPSVTFARTTTGPLAGTGSGLFTKGATNRQGDGVSYAFTVDPAYRGKPQQIKFDLDLVSGTWSGSTTPGTNSDVTVWIYDVTNSQLIQPAGSLLDPMTTGQYYQYKGTFQTSLTGASYRLCLHTTTTSASAYAFRTDNFSVGPPVISNGAVVTDWQSYTPTGSWVSNSTYTGLWRRVGDTMEVQVEVTTSGAPTNTNLTVNLPSGYTIDINKLQTATNGSVLVGHARFHDTGTASYGPNLVSYNSTTSVGVAYSAVASNSESGISATVPFTWGNTDQAKMFFRVPIVGWSSNVQMSNDTDTRVVSMQLTDTGTTTSPTGTLSSTPNALNFNRAAAKDTHGGYSGGTYTVPVSGDYFMNAQVEIAHTSSTGSYINMGFWVNGVQKVVQGLRPTITSSFPSVQALLTNLRAGDAVTIRIWTDVTSPTYAASSSFAKWDIFRLSGPSQIAATEKVSVHAYKTSSSSALSAATDTIVTFPIVGKDSHGGLNASFNRYTIQSAGDYRISVNLTFSFGASTTVAQLKIFKNGSIYSMPATTKGASGDLLTTNASIVLPNLVTGDYIEVYGRVDAGSATVIYGDSFKNTSLNVERL